MLTVNIFRLPGELRIGVLIGPAASGSYVWKTHLLFPIYQIAGPRGWDMNDGAEPSKFQTYSNRKTLKRTF